MATVHNNILIKGRVQGVYFRASAKKEARMLRIKGTVRNLSTGEVYIEAEGEEGDMLEFIKWCRVGPPAAEVTSVQIKEGELKHFNSFDILSNH